MKSKVKVRVVIDPSVPEPEVIIRTKQRTELIDKIASTIEQWAESDPPRITVYDGNRVFLLYQRNILRIYTQSRKLIVRAGSGEYEARCSLQDMEKALDPERFARISRFELINMEKASGFDMGISGTIKVIMEDGSYSWVARRYVQSIEQRLERTSAKGGWKDD